MNQTVAVAVAKEIIPRTRRVNCDQLGKFVSEPYAIEEFMSIWNVGNVAKLKTCKGCGHCPKQTEKYL